MSTENPFGVQLNPAPQTTAAPAPNTVPLSTLFPALRPYSKEELSNMAPDQLATIMQGVNQASESINGRTIQLTTQIESLTHQITDMQGRLQTEFGVSSVEELEAQRQQDLAKLETLYAQLSEINLEAPTP